MTNEESKMMMLYKNDMAGTSLTENECLQLLILARDFCVIPDKNTTKESKELVKKVTAEKSYSLAHKVLMDCYFKKYD